MSKAEELQAAITREMDVIKRQNDAAESLLSLINLRNQRVEDILAAQATWNIQRNKLLLAMTEQHNDFDHIRHAPRRAPGPPPLPARQHYAIEHHDDLPDEMMPKVLRKPPLGVSSGNGHRQ